MRLFLFIIIFITGVSTHATNYSGDGAGASFFISSETRLDGLAYSDNYSVGGELYYAKGNYFGSIKSVKVDNIEDDGKKPSYLTSLNFGRRGLITDSIVYTMFLEGTQFANGDDKHLYFDGKFAITHMTSFFAYGIAGGYSPNFHGLYGQAIYGKGFIATQIGDLILSTSYGRVGSKYEFGDVTASYPLLPSLVLTMSYNAVGSGNGLYEEIDDDSVSGKLSLSF
jgi:hypothetical protein